MNPLAQPATILGQNQAIPHFEGFVNKVMDDVEKKRQLADLKQKGIDAALLPPDIDLKGAFQYEIGEITNDLDKYSNTKADLATHGVDITSPQYAGQFSQVENGIKAKTIQSLQHQALYDKAVQSLASKDASETYDMDASHKKIAEFVAEAGKGVNSATDYLRQNSSLLVPKPYDIDAEADKIAKEYGTTTTETDPVREGGIIKTTTTKTMTPENILGAGALLARSNPQAKRQLDLIYSSFTPQKRAEYEQMAINAGGQAGDGVNYFAGVNKILPRKDVSVTNDIRNVPTGGRGGSKEKAPTSNLLVDQVLGVLDNNPNYVKKDENGYTVTDAFDGQVLGTFQQGALKGYENGDTSKPVYDYKQTPIVVQHAIKNPKDGMWYVQTNESVYNKKGSPQGAYTNMEKYTPADFKNLMYKIATQSGEWTSDKIDKYAESIKRYNPDNSLKAPEPTPEGTDIYFNGKTEMVKEDPKIVNGVKVFKLNDGTWVKWGGKEWIKSQYQGGQAEETKSSGKTYKVSGKDYDESQIKTAADASGMSVEEYLKAIGNE